ncbi:MAG: MFS transporter [Acidobacteria bacterium]|nr:MFS transporter [Acidobacteriota bacterium]
MMGFLELLRTNRNYRYTWMGQVVSEIGDHFNNIAVFSLAYEATGSGMVVAAVMIARGLAVLVGGPIAGVMLDRWDRKRIMIASDLARMVVALCFILAVGSSDAWLLYLLSAALMFASPFFTSGRSAILPAIAAPRELQTANALTQTTSWTNVAVGAFLSGIAIKQFGYETAFLLNSLSFLFSAFCIWRLRSASGAFKAIRDHTRRHLSVPPWHDYRDGLRYMVHTPLILAIMLVHVGWATGGGAAQILFTLFGEQVFRRGAQGIGTIWGCAGIGLIAGGLVGHRYARRLPFRKYKRAIAVCYLIHGAAYVIFSLTPSFMLALLFIGLSRAAVAVSSVFNYNQLLLHVKDEYRGRVFSTNETLTWSMMMISMLACGIASLHYSPRLIGAVAGVLSSTTALFWTWANATGWLPEPPLARDEHAVESPA